MTTPDTESFLSQESIKQIRGIVEDFTILAERHEEASQRIQQGLLVDSSWFAGPQIVLVNAAPGLGKTVALIKVAEELRDSLPVLQLGPSHDSFSNVGRISPWSHWQGHDDGRKSGTPCPRSVRAGKGYTSGEECSPTCPYTPAKFSGVPTFAPVDYILNPDQPTFPLDEVKTMSPTPLASEAVMYPWWAIDDVGLDRFVGKTEVLEEDLLETKDYYPLDRNGAELVRLLADTFLVLLAQNRATNEGKPIYQQEAWNGLDLYDRLDKIFQTMGTTTQEVLDGLVPLKFSTEPWSASDDPSSWPLNYMPDLKQKFMAGMADWVLTQRGEPIVPLQPHIHVVWAVPDSGGPLQSVLRVRWHRRPSLLRPILLLDATGDRVLIEKAFRVLPGLVAETEPIDTPDFPKPNDMKVSQFWGNHITRGTLQSNPEKKSWQRKIEPLYRNLLIRELSKRRDTWSGSEPPKVGLVTFKNLEDDAKKAMTEAGISPKQQVTDHYYNVRGSNSFTKCDFVVILGYPIPNPQGLYEEACVLFFNDLEPLSRERQPFELPMTLRNGQTILIDDIPGYADQRMHALYRQKSVSELYQAFHRARPYGTTQVKEVLVFTDVPIDGIPVDGFFCEGRHGRAFDILTRLFDEGDGDVTTPQLAAAIAEANPELESSLNAVNTWVRRPASVKWLTRAIGCEFIEGNSKTNPHRFRRTVTTA